MNAIIRKEKNATARANSREKWKKRFLGSAEKRGWIGNVVVYTLLIVISFIFVYPVLYMISRSLMSRSDGPTRERRQKTMSPLM